MALSIRHFLLGRCCCQRTITSIRFYSSIPKDHVKPPSKVKWYFIDKFKHYIEGYEKFLGTKYPKIFGVYNTFKGGVHGLLSDTRMYYSVTLEMWRGTGLHNFSYRQLQVYRQMPHEMLKATPLLVISALPLGGAIFAVAYFFPRLLLTTHFWTPKQRREFWSYDHKHRLHHLSSVFSGLKKHQKHIEDPELGNRMKKIVQKLQHSVHPTVTEILEVKPLFESYTYAIQKLSLVQKRHLAKGLGLPLRKSGLIQDGLILLHTDRAMVREGIEKLTEEDIEQACFARGLNPIGLSRTERIQYLKQWTQISEEVDEDSISLLLHSPVFLAYNHPTNRGLIGRQRFK
ncbi:hypothetical protein ScPMuIL_016787 [Solemya velum]